MNTNQQERQGVHPAGFHVSPAASANGENPRDRNMEAGLSTVTVSGQNLVVSTPKTVSSFTYYDSGSQTYKEIPDPAANPSGFKSMFGTDIGRIKEFFQYTAIFNESFNPEDAGYYGVATTLKCRVNITPTYVGDQWYTFYSSPWRAGNTYGWSAIDHISVDTSSILSFELSGIEFFKKDSLVNYYLLN